MFEDLGLKYLGPIDGHDIKAVESALRRAKRFHGPVLVHCLTVKGRGYEPALAHEEDHFHTVGVMDPLTCEPLAPSNGPSWTSVFGEEIVRIGEEREDVVAITAAMLHPVGLGKFAERFPDRVWDVGIAEQHAAVSAAGLATGGLHPVVAVYATFLNRAFDQLLMDVALHRCGVTFVLDRAGVTGTDGPSHNGIGTCRSSRSCPGSGSPPRATPTSCAHSCARRSPWTTRPPWSASRRSRSARASRPSTGSAAWTSCTAPKAPRCCWWPSG